MARSFRVLLTGLWKRQQEESDLVMGFKVEVLTTIMFPVLATDLVSSFTGTLVFVGGQPIQQPGKHFNHFIIITG